MEHQYNELYGRLAHLHWLLHRYYLQNHVDKGPFADPARGQGRVMAILKLQSKMSTRELSYLLGIRQQSLNELLNKLEKNGYIVRTPSEEDRRVMMVTLTEKGKAEQPHPVDHSEIFEWLTPDERDAFGEYLDRVIAALEDKLGAGADADGMRAWMDAARAHMGDDMFERMRSMGGLFHPHGHGRGHGAHGGAPFGDGGPDAPESGPFGPHGRGRHGPFGPHGRGRHGPFGPHGRSRHGHCSEHNGCSAESEAEELP